MNKDQRLIPFLGGLAIGGIGGAIFDNNRYYPYQYPTNYYYPYQQYNSYYPLPQNQSYYPNMNNTYPIMQSNATKMMGDVPSIVTSNIDNRSYIYDASYVPPYIPY